MVPQPCRRMVAAAMTVDVHVKDDDDNDNSCGTSDNDHIAGGSSDIFDHYDDNFLSINRYNSFGQLVVVISTLLWPASQPLQKHFGIFGRRNSGKTSTNFLEKHTKSQVPFQVKVQTDTRFGSRKEVSEVKIWFWVPK